VCSADLSRFTTEDGDTLPPPTQEQIEEVKTAEELITEVR
jgi:hypothetical protein